MSIRKPDMPANGTGRCLCGTVTFEWLAKPLWAAHCHCESCRRHCSAPFTSFFGMRDGAWGWTGGAPALYGSSPGTRRYFCATCGTPMAYASDTFPGETHFYASSLDEPECYDPKGHVHFDEALSWIHLSDTLPRHGSTSV
ncbi:MAG: GFA family protein [Pseudomonadota bacterium]